MADSSKNKDYSEGIFQDQSENFVRNLTETVKENLPSAGKYASGNQRLPSPRSVKMSHRLSNQTPTPSSQAPNCDELDETFSSADVYSYRELRNHTNCSRSANAHTSPLHSPTNSGTKANRRDRSSFGENRNAGFAPPLERSTVAPVIISFSKVLQETNTPSSEKRSVKIDKEFTPTKRMKQKLESCSGKSETAMKCFYKSPINLQTQSKAGVRRKEESKSSLTTPLIPSKIERKIMESSSGDSKSVNDAFKSNLSFPTSAANIDHKSPSDLQTQGTKGAVRNVEESESATEGKRLITFRVCSTDSNSLAKNSDPDYLHQTGSYLNLITNENESTIHPNGLTDASTNADLESGKQKNRSHILAEGALPNLPSRELETTAHRLGSTNKPSDSNLATAPKPDFRSCIEIKKTRYSSPVSSKKTQPASNVADSAIEMQRLKSSQYTPLILNPHFPLLPPKVLASGIETRGFKSSQSRPVTLKPPLPSSCHLPQRSNFNKQHRHPDISGDINNPLSRDDGAKSTVSREQVLRVSSSKSRPEMSRDCSRTSPEFRKTLQRSAAKTASASRIPLGYRRQHGRSGQLLMKLIVSNKPLRPTNPEVETQQNRNDRWPQRKHAGSILCESSTISRNRPDLEGEVGPTHIAVFESEASTSGHQPLVKEDSFADGQPSSSSEVPQSAVPCERMCGATEQCIPFHADKFPIYASEAHTLLYLVLEEIMRYNDEMDEYMKFVKLDVRFCLSSSEVDRTNLNTELMSYLAQKGYGLLENVMLQPLEDRQPGTYTMEAYGMLTWVVVTTLISTLTLRSCQDFDESFNNYQSFRSLYDTFSQYCVNDNIEDVEDEPSRNRLTALKKMIQRLLLVTLMAFRLLLMYIGENAEPRKIEIYEETLSEEDKKYLRR